jgi:hypothetical protein
MSPQMRVKKFNPEIAITIKRVSVVMFYPMPITGRCCGAAIENT